MVVRNAQSGYCYRANDWSSPRLLALAVAVEEYGDTLPDGSTERDYIREAVRQIGLADKHTTTVASATSLSLPTAKALGDGIMSDATGLQNRDSEVRNTQHSSDMVERVAKAIERRRFAPWINDGMASKLDVALARAALEASHHAELVEALERAAAATRTLARNILDDVGPGTCDGWVVALNTISRNIEADLAKIGGEA